MSSHGSFGDYFASWMSRLEDFLPLLLFASNYPIPPSREHQACLHRLIADVTLHHKCYYAEKWASFEAHGGGGDVFAFFSMPWMTSLERAYLWIMGWKPSAAFRIMESLREGKCEGRGRGGVRRGKVEEAIKEIGAGMEKVMKAGDSVRLRTLGGLMEVLSPSQGVGFLGALTLVLLRMRDQGLKRSRGNSSVAGNDTSEPTKRA
ncbi:hypothetical protein MLD38_010297 [Melastoma candidum]|uniref:Uncharacterized protein n=1 Tax=Melastoma candidum TaxID=119954 RepID=A0ACB9QZD3_9MYRT|nr:hypothetical protein MLD38_010297 [Melastoma candidum]